MAVAITRDQHDDYWKLDLHYNLTAKEMRALLEERHYNVGTLMDKGRLKEHLRRTDLGLPSYYDLTIDGLRALLALRKVSSDHGTSYGFTMKRRLVKWLEEADLHPDFNRFLGLPPELRNKVYGYYYAGLRQPIYAPSQPPLSRICRQIRKESLPMFYAVCEFEFRLQRYTQLSKWSTTTADTVWRLTICDRMLLFLHSTPPENLAAIRNLRVVVDDEKRHISTRADWWHLYRLHIAEDDTYTVHETTAVTLPHRIGWVTVGVGAKYRLMTATVRRVTAAIASREAKNKLRKADFYDLRRALELGLL